MTNKQHPYAEILRAIADGKTVQVLTDCGEWIETDRNSVFYFIINERILRVKPATIRIGEYDVPEPERVEPYKGCKYYIPDMILLSGHEEYGDLYSYVWDDSEFEKAFLKNGVVHLNKEAAEIHSKALISLTKQD